MHNVYPFSVARNQSIGWTPILLPQPLINAEVGYSLVLDTADAEAGSVIQKNWTDPDANVWLVMYRRKPLMGYHAGQKPAEEQLTDRFGRELSFVEGGFIYTPKQLPDRRAGKILDTFSDEIQSTLEKFWLCDELEFQPVSSTPHVSSVNQMVQLAQIYVWMKEKILFFTEMTRAFRENFSNFFGAVARRR